MRYFSILTDQQTRADKVISALFEDIYSRSQIQKGFTLGQVKIINKKDGKSYSNPKYYPRKGDIIEMEIKSIPSTLPPDYRPLEIIFENDDFLVVSKDAGINTHPTPSYAGKFGTLVNQLIAQVKNFDRERGEDRPGIVHRLDKDTSGLLLVAKNDATLRNLQKLIHDHKVQKKYLALVIGEVTDTLGTIKSVIGRDPNNRLKMTIKNPVEGREAITHYKVIETLHYLGKTLTLVEVTLETGRTHQIRVHMANIGHPILGDKTYGVEYENNWAQKHFGLERQFLHAWKLGFEMEKTEYSFEADLKSDLQKVLTIMRD
ncbi:RluA family pseudouridine synthase [Candidatus Gracilibacteria bacterium]|nr:RluA family pseudouridine synthase [Candidatus Gracilibacteria bacterium]